jgi:hypothetical protein
LFLLLAVFLSDAAAQGEVSTPRSGDRERRAILDALRVPVEKELGPKVVFKVDHLKVQGGWAFLRGVPQRPGGRAVDYRGTVYGQALEDGVFDDWVCALLRKRGGKWQVVKYVVGATDVPYVGWDEEFGAPAAIFKD